MAVFYNDAAGNEFNFSKYSINRLAHIWAFCPGAACDAAERELRNRGWLAEDFELIEKVLLEGPL